MISAPQALEGLISRKETTKRRGGGEAHARLWERIQEGTVGEAT